MGLQSWMIKSWPIIEWFPPRLDDEWPSFLHMSTQVRQERQGAEPCAGSTVWVGNIGSAYAGLAWEWVELRPGVLMLADPNSITSNICVLGGGGRVQGALPTTVSLNRILHQLPWQGPVGEVLAVARSAALEPGKPGLSAEAARASDAFAA